MIKRTLTLITLTTILTTCGHLAYAQLSYDDSTRQMMMDDRLRSIEQRQREQQRAIEEQQYRQQYQNPRGGYGSSGSSDPSGNSWGNGINGPKWR